jgi:hypothetical protein
LREICRWRRGCFTAGFTETSIRDSLEREEWRLVGIGSFAQTERLTGSGRSSYSSAAHCFFGTVFIARFTAPLPALSICIYGTRYISIKARALQPKFENLRLFPRMGNYKAKRFRCECELMTTGQCRCKSRSGGVFTRYHRRART